MDHDLERFWREFTSLAYQGDINTAPNVFRGVVDVEHLLIPSIGRNTEENTGGEIFSIEDNLMTEFKRLTAPIINSNDMPKTDFEWLFLAQHYGLPTRLLDWSTHPLVALYFAVEKEDHTNGGVYFGRQMLTDQYELFDYRTADYRMGHHSVIAIQPNQKNAIFLRPKYSDQRHVNQSSVFSCPANPFKPLSLDSLQFIEFKSEWKPELRRRLRTMGVSTSFIYPGLSGIASEIKSFVYDPVANNRVKIISIKPAPRQQP
ncbi:TPA: FRG domain-containing protein [Vibrio parahaemolyticus]